MRNLGLKGRPRRLHPLRFGWEPIAESVSLRGGSPDRYLLEPVTGAVVGLPLADASQLGHEVLGFAAGESAVAQPVLDALPVVLIQSVTALVATEILAVRGDVPVVVVVSLFATVLLV